MSVDKEFLIAQDEETIIGLLSDAYLSCAKLCVSSTQDFKKTSVLKNDISKIYSYIPFTKTELSSLSTVSIRRRVISHIVNKRKNEVKDA